MKKAKFGMRALMFLVVVCFAANTAKAEGKQPQPKSDPHEVHWYDFQWLP